MAKFNLYTRADQSRDFQSGSLSSGYIYYDILGQEGNPDMARLRSQVSNRLEKVKNQLNDHSIAVQVLREMARAEYEKEVSINLREVVWAQICLGKCRKLLQRY